MKKARNDESKGRKEGERTQKYKNETTTGHKTETRRNKERMNETWQQEKRRKTERKNENDWMMSKYE